MVFLLFFSFFIYIIYSLFHDGFIWRFIIGTIAWLTIYSWLYDNFPSSHSTIISVLDFGLSSAFIIPSAIVYLAYKKYT